MRREREKEKRKIQIILRLYLSIYVYNFFFFYKMESRIYDQNLLGMPVLSYAHATTKNDIPN